MLYRRCGRCGKRIESGSRCECLKKRHSEYDRYSRDRKSKAFYNSPEWRRKREDILELDAGIDVYMFMTTEKIILADTVHHIIPIKDDWSKRFDSDNLMSLNHDTHSMIENKYRDNKQETINELRKMLQKFRKKQL